MITAASAHSTRQDSFEAGKEMASKALSQMDTDRTDFAFLFASSEHDSKALIRGVRSVIGDEAGMAGGTSTGVITNDHLGYEGFQAGTMLLASDDVFFRTHMTNGLDKGEYETGVNAGKALSDIHQLINPNLFLLYDNVQSNPDSPVPFYQTTPILDGIRSMIGTFPPVSGIGFATGPDRRSIGMWDAKDITSDAVLSLVIHGNIRMDTTIMHGCRPATDYHTITRSSGNKVFEIDHQPATRVVSEYLGKEESDVDWKNLLFSVTLGFHRVEKYTPFQEKDYVNRMVMGADPSEGTLVLLEGDIGEGDDFQFMRRSYTTEMVAEEAMKLRNSLNGRTPVFALYVSCLGRVKNWYGTETEEGDEVRQTIGKEVPLLGIYSGVEIARVKDQVMPLDWTGVLSLFSVPG